jgi:DNA (cytosine-5)-methyltransferase 1
MDIQTKQDLPSSPAVALGMRVSKVKAKASASGRRFSVISLFSGCGGMDLGFRGGFEFLGKKYSRLPFDIVWANDINVAACGTYRKNIGPHIIPGDIWSVMDQMPQSADVVIGGFPCQDISVNGKGAGIDGKRSGLYRAMVEVVARVQPKIFIAENVKGLLMRHNAKSLERVLADFKRLGYDITFQLYNAADYGVPQTRERVIIVGTHPNAKKFTPPAPVHSKEGRVTAREAIDDLARLPENEAFNNVWSKANKSGEQGNRKLLPDRPGYTIRAECHGNIQFHYKLTRRISMREAARFQSFPDDFIFDSKLRETERQVGNAVAPVFAWHIAQAVQKSLEDANVKLI